MNTQTVNAANATANAVENLNYGEDFEERMDVPANEEVITYAFPISYYFPSSTEVKSFPKQESVIGNSPPSSKRNIGARKKPLPAEYIDNWDIKSTPRKDGKRVDKYYHHKVEGFICRSVEEVKRFEEDGIRPQHKRKAEDNKKEHKNTKDKIKEMPAVENDADAEVENSKVYVEGFLAKAQYNLLHSFDS